MAKATFSPKQRLVLAQLVAGKSISEAAIAVGVSESAIYRWLRGEHGLGFKAALDSLVDEALGDTIDDMTRRLSAGGPKAITKILNLVDNGKEEDTQLRAAVAMLDRFIRLIQLRGERKAADESTA
jgi:transposase-like protein